MGSYTKMIENMLDGMEVRLGEDCLEKKAEYEKRIIMTDNWLWYELFEVD